VETQKAVRVGGGDPVLADHRQARLVCADCSIDLRGEVDAQFDGVHIDEHLGLAEEVGEAVAIHKYGDTGAGQSWSRTLAPPHDVLNDTGQGIRMVMGLSARCCWDWQCSRSATGSRGSRLPERRQGPGEG
jgi:hypothetical protein